MGVVRFCGDGTPSPFFPSAVEAELTACNMVCVLCMELSGSDAWCVF